MKTVEFNPSSTAITCPISGETADLYVGTSTDRVSVPADNLLPDVGWVRVYFEVMVPRISPADDVPDATIREKLREQCRVIVEKNIVEFDMNMSEEEVCQKLGITPEEYQEMEEQLEELRRVAQTIIDDFGPIERKKFPFGLGGTFLSPAGKTVNSERIEALKNAMKGKEKDGRD